jgi:hypothetical protein
LIPQSGDSPDNSHVIAEAEAMMSSGAQLTEIIDARRYPIHEPGTAAHEAVVARCRESLAEDGCCTLRGFLRTDAVERIAQEAERLAPQAHRQKASHNPYFCEARPDIGDEHPVNRFQERTNGFVCADLIDPECELHTLYGSDSLTHFVSEVFEIDPLYRYADPLACMPFNAMEPGDSFPWHFDTNEFTVTWMIRPPDRGGVFEYAPGIRDPEDEHYDDVAAVMAGDRTRVRTLDLGVGDMQLFMGRYTLHRVTEVEGTRARHVAIPSWARQPDMVGQPHRMKHLYGRVLPVHLERAGMRADNLVD